MTVRRRWGGVVVALGLFGVVGRAGAVSSPGWRELAVQIPDIQLKAKVPIAFPVELKTIDLDNTLPADSGLYAMSTVPGLSVVSAYAFSPSQTIPAFQWAPVAVASGYDANSQPWNGHFNGVTDLNIIRFAATYDGTAAAGTVGSIQVAVNEGDEFTFTPRVIGQINVYLVPTPRDTWFMVTGTTGNTSANRVVLNHPLLNGKPTAVVFASHVVNPPGGTAMAWNHPISAGYDAGLGRWYIQNDDQAAMPRGIAFSVRIDPSGRLVLAPDWTNSRLCLPSALHPVLAVPVHHPSADNNPYATIIVTAHTPDTGHLAVQYNAGLWSIVHTDGSQFPTCSSFEVQVLGFTAYSDFNYLLAGWLDPFASNGAGETLGGNGAPAAARDIPFWWALGNPDEPIIATENLSPPSAFFLTPVADPAFVGLAFSGGPLPHWQVVHEDGSQIPDGAGYNLWGAPQVTP
jgi:hypothetical protein